MSMGMKGLKCNWGGLFAIRNLSLHNGRAHWINLLLLNRRKLQTFTILYNKKQPFHDKHCTACLLSVSTFPCFQWCNFCHHSCTLSKVREGNSHIFHSLCLYVWLNVCAGGRKKSRQGEKEGGMESRSWDGGWETRGKPDGHIGWEGPVLRCIVQDKHRQQTAVIHVPQAYVLLLQRGNHWSERFIQDSTPSCVKMRHRWSRLLAPCHVLSRPQGEVTCHRGWSSWEAELHFQVLLEWSKYFNAQSRPFSTSFLLLLDLCGSAHLIAAAQLFRWSLLWS